MRTYQARKGDIQARWWLVDAAQHKLGRLSSQVAQILRGKNKPQFTPNTDVGDFVVVVNAKQVQLTGRKKQNEKHFWHSGFFGSLKERNLEQELDVAAPRVIERAVRRMLPKNRLSRQVIKKLKVYEGAEHPHAAQKPEALSF